MTERTIDTTRTPATKERPWESGIRRGQDTIEVLIPHVRGSALT